MQVASKVAVIALALLMGSACGGREGGPMFGSADRALNIQSALVYDTNKDGEVTRDEIEAGLKREFAAADRNGDGYLDLPEMQAENQRRFNANQSGFSPLIDWNRDGKLDMTEFSTTIRSLFAELDGNQNGVLAGIELRIPPRRPQSPQMPMRQPGI